MMNEGQNAMDALRNFHLEPMEIFASHVETEMGFLVLLQWLDSTFNAAKSTNPWILPSISVQMGKGDPNLPSTRYNYETPWAELKGESEEGGRNPRMHRNGIICLTYALWEEHYRGAIASECGLACKNKVQSDVFQDLNKYRQSILHRGSVLDRVPMSMKFFAKGERVAVTKEQMESLFACLVEELNRIGSEYYKTHPGFEFEKPIR